MTEDKKTLPTDFSESSLPGRFEESNYGYFDHEQTKPKNKIIWIAVIIFSLVSASVFTYYFTNQQDIDNKILQNTIKNPEQMLIQKYNIGEYGSDHAHAAIAIFIENEALNFGLPQFQLKSKYIHFENNNPYLIHRHATGVPLEMLFTSIGIKITPDCIILNDDNEPNIINHKFCLQENKSLFFYVNGQKYDNISQYVINHGDRILISFGTEDAIPSQIQYLQSLKIYNIPKSGPPFEDQISL